MCPLFCVFSWVVLFLLLLGPRPCEAAVRALGLPEWLTPLVEKSLSAVEQEIEAARAKNAPKEPMIRAVSERLFAGYRVAKTFDESGTLSVYFEVSREPPQWGVRLISPELSPPVNDWFAEDCAFLREQITSLLEGVPLEALAWCDVGLRDAVAERTAQTLPGWRISLVVRAEGGETFLEVHFTPSPPFVLAVAPFVSSSSLPLLLYSSLKEDVVLMFAPIIGLPLPWVARHKEELVAWSERTLAGKWVLQDTHAEASVQFTAQEVSHVDVELESRRYVIWAWVAAYAGTSDRYPEFGLHLGRRARILPRWKSEIYGELILDLHDASLEKRLGLRWSPWKSVWVGAEWASADDMWWLRVSTEARLKRPYGWVRIREDGHANFGVGWRAGEHFSIEVHYDERDDDKWSLRFIGNL